MSAPGRRPRAFVAGWPIAHSRSPLIHGYWLRSLGLAGSYERVAVAPADFAAFAAGLRDAGWAGGNVTIPHKEAAAKVCDELTPAARRLGAVNTLWLEGGRLRGDNTDGTGFLGALDQEVPCWDERRDMALVLGAGGAARAIVDALLARGFARVCVANRSVARAEALSQLFEAVQVEAVQVEARQVEAVQVEAGRVEALDLPGAERVAASADILVNTTPAGMAGQPALAFDLARLPPHAVVDDIVYVPRETPLLRAAAARGLRTVGGLGMLLHQAVPGFERWFGRRPAVTPDLRAALEADIAAQT